jgi:DNA-binding GntR family transcriptional regulator
MRLKYYIPVLMVLFAFTSCRNEKSKKLQPGQKIVQDKLAADLGISRTPLRTALQMLEAESLVESLPRRGMIVKEFSDSEIIEIYDCRNALEGTAIRLFTENCTTTDISNLKKLFQPFKKNTKELDRSLYQIADMVFHNTIIEKCGNSFLARLFKNGNLLEFIDLIGLKRPATETLTEHLNIIDAIEKKDTDLAEQLIKEHLDKSKILIQKNK